MKHPPILDWTGMTPEQLALKVHQIQTHDLFNKCRWCFEGSYRVPTSVMEYLAAIGRDTLCGDGVSDFSDELWRWKLYDFIGYIAAYRGLRVNEKLPVEQLLTALEAAQLNDWSC